EYSTAFAITFETAAPALDRARRDGLTWSDAVVETFLYVLAAVPDTHIARRAGQPLAVEVTREAEAVLALGGVRSQAGRAATAASARAVGAGEPGTPANPGPPADLTAAAIFVVLVGGGWTLPDAFSGFSQRGHDATTR